MKLNNILKTIRRALLAAATLTAAATTLTSCDSVIFDDEGDCEPHYKVRFRYDYNLKKANAFSQEVKAVTLYIVDPATGNVVWRKTESSAELLENEEYMMDVDGIAPGNYKLLVWAGDGHVNPSHFLHNGNAQHHADLGVSIVRDGSRAGSESSVSVDLDPLYKDLSHEYTTREFTDKQGTQIHTVRLMKNTNDIHIVLQQLSGEAVNPADFTFEITSDNGQMDYDNTLIPGDTITYRPWQVKAGIAQGFVPDNLQEAQFSATIADFTVGRMVKGDDMILTVRRSDDGSLIAKVPVIDYALLVKGHYDSMPDQEYLDRQDNYSMVFFLDEDHRWLSAVIYINSWRVVLQNTEL